MLVVETEQDRKVLVRTDAAWKATTGPILKSDMKDGEIYDARLEMPGWHSPGFIDHTWKAVRLVQHPKNILSASMGVLVRRKETFNPQILKAPNSELSWILVRTWQE
jgi:alpha-L-rhamnosidase